MTITNRDDISTENVTDAAHRSPSVGDPNASAPSSTPSESAAISVDETLDSTAAEQAVMGVAEPASSIPVSAPRAKTRGVADIVFLIDISGSMKPCIDALRANIELFIDFLSAGNANEGLRDWRGKVVG